LKLKEYREGIWSFLQGTRISCLLRVGSLLEFFDPENRPQLELFSLSLFKEWRAREFEENILNFDDCNLIRFKPF